MADLPKNGACRLFVFLIEVDFNKYNKPFFFQIIFFRIQDQLEQTVVLPNSVTVSLIPENELDEIIRKKNDKRCESVALPSGVLSVNVIEAKGIVTRLYTFV